MTDSTEDQQQSEPGGASAQAKPQPAAAAVAAARTGIRQQAGAPSVAGAQRQQVRLFAVVPVYDQPAKLAAVVQQLRHLGLPVVLVDDGSHEPTKSLCDRLAAPQVKVVHHAVNQGKGGAVMTGFKTAGRMGATHVLQIDADGQIDFSAVPNLIRLSAKYPHALICGAPQFDASAPSSRKWGRRVTNFWCSINSLSMDFADAMCGLRVYPLDSALAVCENAKLGRRMDFDPEILVRLLWAGVRVKNVAVSVTYPEDGVSHFAPFKDTMRISWMHAKLFLQMATRMPIILWSRMFGWAPVCERDDDAQAGGAKTAKAPRAAAASPAAAAAKPAAAQKAAKPAATTVKSPVKPVPKRPPMTPEEDERARRAFHAAEVAKRNADRAIAEIDLAASRKSAEDANR